MERPGGPPARDDEDRHSVDEGADFSTADTVTTKPLALCEEPKCCYPGLVGGAHTCALCNGHIHAFCGFPENENEEGYGARRISTCDIQGTPAHKGLPDDPVDVDDEDL